MSSYLKALALYLLFHVAHIGYSQNEIVRFERITNNDGLSSNQVNCIYQDKTGFIWFGTDDGLNRFNGLDFTVYKHSIKNVASLKDNYIDAIVEDAEGNLIIGTSKGLSVFNRTTDTFSLLDFKDLPESVSNGNVESLLVDNRNNLWVSIEGIGLFNLLLDEQKFNFYGMEEGLISPTIESLTIDKNGVVWAIADAKLHYFLYDHFERINFSNTPLETAEITHFIEGAEGSFWVGTANSGLFVIENGRITGNELSGNILPVLGAHEKAKTIQSIYMDSNKIVWVGIEGEGLVRINKNVFQTYRSSPQNPFSLSYNSILTIYEDNVGDIWFGTVAGGVSTIHFTKQNFQNLSNNEQDASLNANDVTRISESKSGLVWIGTKTGGITRFDPARKTFDHFTEDNSFIKNNSVEAVLGTKDGYLWLGGWKSGLYQLTEDFKLLRSFDMDNSALLSDNIFDLLEDWEGNVWVGTIGGGLAKVSRDYQITSYLKNKTVEDESPITLALDSSGYILLGGYRGLTQFDPSNETTKRYFFKEDLSGISSNTIQCMLVVNKDSIWIGTDDGLNLFNPIKGSFNHYFEEDGLPSNAIKSLVQEGQNLWISTTNGISKLDLIERTFRNFTQLDGLQGRRFTSNSSLKTSTRDIYFGGVNGITRFSADKIALNTKPPEIKITDVKINSVSIRNRVDYPLQAEVSELERLSLKPEHSYLSFSFIALNYISSENNQYAYRLEGFDDSWIYTRNPTAFYSNIDPGQYIFRVKASNNNGIWNESGAILKITVLRPWWATWWFRTLYISGILGSIYLFFWLRTKRLRFQKIVLTKTVSERTKQLEERKEELEKTLEDLKKTQIQLIQSEKMASLGVLTAGIAHEINNPLQFIRGGKEIIEKELERSSVTANKLVLKSLDSIEEGVQRTSAILQSLNRFNDTKEEIKSCDVHFIIDNCLTMLNSSFQGKIEVEKKYQGHLFIEGNEGELHQVFLNILQNSGQAIQDTGRILIETFTFEKEKIVVITDSGIGIDQKTINRIIEPFFTTKNPGKGPGLGLAIGYQIIKKHNGDISIESTPEEGTKISIRFFE